MQHEENDSSANTTPSVSAQEPQSDSQHSPSVPTTDPATTPDTTSETASDTEPETDTNGEVVPDGVRVGSPFLVDPIIPVATAVHFSNDPEVLAAGVWQETVGGAYVASIMLSVFALVSAPFFPAGGVLIALLGIVMGLLGVGSRWPVHSVSTSLFCLVAMLGNLYFLLA